MSLEIVIGCMKSGKSTYVIEKYMGFTAIRITCMVINHSCDTRYGTNVVSNHNKKTIPCINVDTLMPLGATTEYMRSTHIIIEESHFFSDLRKFVEKCLIDGKHLIVIGLSGDYKGNPFGQVLDCIPLAERVTHHRALCEVCCDGTPASFSHRLDASTDAQVFVGGSDKYIAVCRKHWLTE